MPPEPQGPESQASRKLQERGVWEMLKSHRPSARQRLEAAYVATTVAVLVFLGFVWLGRSASEGAFGVVKALMGQELLQFKSGIMVVFMAPALLIAVGHHMRTKWTGFSTGLLFMSGIVLSLGALFIALASAAFGCGAAMVVAVMIGGYEMKQALMPAYMCAITAPVWMTFCVLVNIANAERKCVDPRWVG